MPEDDKSVGINSADIKGAGIKGVVTNSVGINGGVKQWRQYPLSPLL